jgi:mannosyltransferase OCH1-like enzyme
LLKSAVATVRLSNPDFEHNFFDNDRMCQFVDRHFPHYRGAFDAFPLPIQRFDFFRYLAVYQLGGFYFDTDVFLASSLEELLTEGCVFPFESLTTSTYLRKVYGIDWEVGNYAFGALPGHPFIGQLISNCIRSLEDSRWIEPMMRSIPRVFRREFTVLYSTGPGMVTRSLAEYPEAAGQVRILFPEDVRDQDNWNLFGRYGVHVMQGRWRQRNSRVRRRLLVAWQSWRGRKLLDESAKLGNARSLTFGRRQPAC